MGVLKSQEHVLEDTQGSSPHDGVQQLREDLKRRSRQGSADRSDPGAQLANSGSKNTDVCGSWMEQ